MTTCTAWQVPGKLCGKTLQNERQTGRQADRAVLVVPKWTKFKTGCIVWDTENFQATKEQ